MFLEYDQITAFHYAAFRPDLHGYILDKHFSLKGPYKSALDLGSGTGQSSIALAKYCDEVFGVEPSKSMLDKSIQHAKVQYSFYDKERLDFVDDFFEITTLAGSLYYAKSQQLLHELVRVNRPNGKILVYDFQLSLDDIITQLVVSKYKRGPSTYNHKENFEGLNESKVKKEGSLIDQTEIKVSILELSHLLLSTKVSYGLLLSEYGSDDLLNMISEKLRTIHASDKVLIAVSNYSTLYSVIK